MYLGIGNVGQQSLGAHEVVDAPAGILLTRLETVRPPRIGDLLGIQGAEGVDESAGQQVAEGLALFVGKAGIHPVALGVLQVYLLVGHIQVATKDDGLLAVQSLQIAAEGVFPRQAVLQPLQSVLRVGRVAAHQEEVVHLQGDDAPLVVVYVDADAQLHVQRLMTGEDRRTRVAFLVGIIPIAVVALERQVQLTGLHLRLLQTEEVGIQRLEHLAEALALAGPQSIHIPTDQFHILRRFCRFRSAKLRKVESKTKKLVSFFAETE